MRQLQALAVMLRGDSVFLTGEPGAGKTYVLNEFIGRMRVRGHTVAVTASTGIAATHVGGTTIHAWSGLGIRDVLHPHDIEWLKQNDKLRKRYNATDVLVIDEVSMLHGQRLNMVNEAAQLLRENDEPFGGMQVVLVGDLFQLPPVSPGREIFDFAHKSQAWRELAPKICYITEQHRQTDDSLLSVLQAMRNDAVDTMHLEALQTRLGQIADDERVTRLFTHNANVDQLNDQRLNALDGRAKVYTMATKGAKQSVEQLQKGLLAPVELRIKAGAEVMFVANNYAEGYVNGSRATVVDFDGPWPMVQLLSNGRVLRVEPYSWSVSEDGKVRAEVSQLPLRLAWAITVHKSQGMSLDAAHIDLSRAFTPGMGYVALSRLRSLDGLYLQGLNAMALALHPEIREFDRSLQVASRQLAERTEDAADEVTPQDLASDDPLLLALKQWRTEQAAVRRIAPYMVLHDTTLESLALRRPSTLPQLSAVKGFGPMKIATYGDDILAVVAAH